MRNSSLLKPVSETAPSGPDLDDAGDAAYLDYIMLAGNRLPERFFSKEGDGSDRDVPFDRSRIDVEAEAASINNLLARTRDLRLLVLEARFNALSGSFRGYADALADLAEMVDLFWDSAHPAPEGDDFGRRVNALEELESQVHVILPLTYAPLVGSGGAAVSYRSYLLASGKARPRDEEPVPSLDAVAGALSSSRNTELTTAVSQAVADAINALTAIRTTFVAKGGHGAAPDLQRELKLLGEIGALLTEMRPDIAAQTGQTGTAVAEGSAEPSAPQPTVGPVRISTSVEAAAALVAIERYFQAREPSTPTLILVHQARMLFGKPLVVALEALLPATAPTAALRFEGTMRFDFGIDQMRAVTDDAAAMAETSFEDESEPDPSAIVFSAESRNDATSLMLGVEAFYRSAEPSSPIPMLLTKARSYLNKDFAVILGELLPRPEQ